MPQWWKQIENKLTRLTNLAVLQLPVASSQALATLATRTMRLQCLVQDGEVWISTESGRVPVELKPLKIAAWAPLFRHLSVRVSG